MNDVLTAESRMIQKNILSIRISKNLNFPRALDQEPLTRKDPENFGEHIALERETIKECSDGLCDHRLK